MSNTQNLIDSNTQIFASYDEFFNRGDKSVNGVTQEFLDGLDEPFKLTNCTACWNCNNCNRCDNCYYCDDCSGCGDCNYCYYCNDCTYCYYCYYCDDCTYCNDLTGCDSGCNINGYGVDS